MPLRDDLLNPIPGENPSGINLRYDRIYDQIKEARTEDDESLPTGAWQRQVKRADSQLVIKLAGEALANRSKDLQLAAWLTEALIKREGIPALEACLLLLLHLQEQFWDTLYPEIDEGDAGMRAVPIEWAANRAAALLREAPLTRSGLTYYQYKDSRSIGYEADAQYDDAKREARERAIQDGKISAEAFDAAFAATPKNSYADLDAGLEGAAAALTSLQEFCEDKYREDGPAFNKLHMAVEEVHHVVKSLLADKRKLEPDPIPEEEFIAEAEPELEPEQSPAAEMEPELPVTRTRAKAVSSEPADLDDAFSRVNTSALFLASQGPSSPVPYLLQTGLRWGELREQGNAASYEFLVCPSTEIRQAIRRLSTEENWAELLLATLSAAGQPCGRGWLDIHRYIWRASREQGYSSLANTVVRSLQSLLKDIPELPTWTLSDDTPTANPETQRWIEQEVVIHEEPVAAPQVLEGSAIVPLSSYVVETTEQTGSEPDIFDTAREYLAQGHVEHAIQLLVRDAAQQPSGRMRFQRKMQVAQLCLSAGRANVAFPMLKQLVEEIESRNLEEWESGELIAQPLALLLKCMDASSMDEDRRDAIFSRLCRIDPTAAIDVSR